MKEKFIEMYGDIDQHLTEEKLMAWYGIWVSAYTEARKEIGEWLEDQLDLGNDPSVVYALVYPSEIKSLKKGEVPE